MALYSAHSMEIHRGDNMVAPVNSCHTATPCIHNSHDQFTTPGLVSASSLNYPNICSGYTCVATISATGQLGIARCLASACHK